MKKLLLLCLLSLPVFGGEITFNVDTSAHPEIQKLDLIVRGVTDTSFIQINQVNPGGNSYTVTNIPPGDYQTELQCWVNDYQFSCGNTQQVTVSGTPTEFVLAYTVTGSTFAGQDPNVWCTNNPICIVVQVNYQIDWDAVTDTRLTGYRVYYSDSQNLTKSTALGTIDTQTNSATYVDRDGLWFAVTSVGQGNIESALSEIVQ